MRSILQLLLLLLHRCVNFTGHFITWVSRSFEAAWVLNFIINHFSRTVALWLDTKVFNSSVGLSNVVIQSLCLAVCLIL